MAEIPQASLPGEDVRPAPLPTPYDQNQATPEVFGAGAGRAADRTAALTEAIATRAKEVADFGVVSAADAAIVQSQTALLHDNTIDEATGKPRGYLYSRGHDAQQRLQPTLDAFDKVVKDQADAANNPQQAMAIRRRGQLAIEEVRRQVTLHAGAQMDELNTAAVKERVQAGLDSAVVNAFDPQAREQAISRLQGYVMGMARLAGDPEDTAGRWLGIQRKAIESIAQHMLAQGRGDLAAQFLDAPLVTRRSPEQIQALATLPPDQQAAALKRMSPTARDILGDQAAPLQKQVETVVTAQRAQAEAQALVPQVLKPNGEVDFTKLNEKLDAMPIDTPEQASFKQHVQSLAEHMAVEKHKAWIQQSQAMHTQVWEQAEIDTDGNGQGYYDVNQVPGPMMAEYERLDPEGARKLRQRSDADARIIRRAERIETTRLTTEGQRRVFNTLALKFADIGGAGRRELAAMTPQAFDSYREQLSIGQFRVLKQEHNKLLANKDKLPPEAAVLRLAADSLGIKRGVPLYQQPPAMRDRLMQLSRSVTDDPTYQQWLVDHPGKTVPPEVLSPIITRLKVQVPQPGTGYFGTDIGADKPYQYEIEARERAAGKPAPAGPAAPAKPPASTPAKPSDQQRKALDWLQKNPDHPNADGVRRRLRAEGLLP